MTQNDLRLENLEKLRLFSSQLKKLSFPTSPVSVDLAEFVANAINDYLEGNTETLDAAFGVKKGMGLPGMNRAYRKAKARQIKDIHTTTESWKLTADKFGGDEREIRRTLDEFKGELFIEELAEEIISELKGEP